MTGEAVDFDAEFDQIRRHLFTDNAEGHFDDLMQYWRTWKAHRESHEQPATLYDLIRHLSQTPYTQDRMKMTILLGVALHRILEADSGTQDH